MYFLHYVLCYCLAAVFLLTGIRLRDTVEQMLHKELICSDANERVKSLQRYLCVKEVWMVADMSIFLETTLVTLFKNIDRNFCHLQFKLQITELNV